MAIVSASPKLELNVTVQLTESEARALDALLGYDMEAFLKVFYEKMGRVYLEPHEKGIRSLGDTLRKGLIPILARMDDAKKAFSGERVREPTIHVQNSNAHRYHYNHD